MHTGSLVLCNVTQLLARRKCYRCATALMLDGQIDMFCGPLDRLIGLLKNNSRIVSCYYMKKFQYLLWTEYRRQFFEGYPKKVD